MKKILLTGGSGFVGSNVLPVLREKYDVYAPTRKELDVRNQKQVEEILRKEKYDTVIHLASPTPVRSAQYDSYEKLFEDCLKIYMNFYSMRNYCGKIIYSGSGAEFDKRYDIKSVKEDSFGESVPIDDYGRAKYIMNEMTLHSDNIYNLRIFGCYGPGEYGTKFITHAIRCCLRGEPITINQNCLFDYLYVTDYAKYLEGCIEKKLSYHDYNACSGTIISLMEIAKIVAAKMDNRKDIIVHNDGFNKEYTASNERIMQEFGNDMRLVSIEDGIEKLIKWEIENEKKSC